jgi:hypothetical protein
VSAGTQKAVAGYLRSGVAVIPIPAGSKSPGHDDWQSLRVSAEDILNYWTNSQGIGLLTGEPSRWLVDVDLDVAEAVKIAGRFLPQTLTSGRESRPHSHWWFRAPGTTNYDWKDTDGKKRLVELRSTGRQTLVAPSTHPSGEHYRWHRESGLDVVEISASKLAARVRELATATLIARHLPPIREERSGEGGGRHDYAMALAGFLLRPGRLDEALVEKILKAAWDAKGWPGEREKREAHSDLEGIVRDTVENLTAGKPVVGGPTLEEMEPGMVRQLCKYWGWQREEQQDEGADEERKPTQSELLIRCAAQAELFHTPAGDSYATIPVGSMRETHPTKSKGFRRYLVREFFSRYERPPGAQALQDALGLLEARAQFDGPERGLRTGSPARPRRLRRPRKRPLGGGRDHGYRMEGGRKRGGASTLQAPARDVAATYPDEREGRSGRSRRSFAALHQRLRRSWPQAHHRLARTSPASYRTLPGPYLPG